MLKNIRAKVFPAPGFKNVLSCYSYSTGFLKKKLIVNAKKRTIMTMPFVYIKLENWKDQPNSREEQQKPFKNRR